jgi:hypothetical protein
MAEHPILFNGEMVRAILEGRKTQTRRICKPLINAKSVADVYHRPDGLFIGTHLKVGLGCGITEPFPCPLGHPGDRLWVRENFQPLLADGTDWVDSDWKTGKGYAINYTATSPVQEFYDCANDEAFCDRVKPSIHMPRWASRITLEITEVRLQRLQDISEEDAQAEGFDTMEKQEKYGLASWSRHCHPDAAETPVARKTFGAIWEQIYAKRGIGWVVNPWVWAVSFKVMSA